MTPAPDPILDPLAPGQVSLEFGSTLRDESNSISLVVLSSQQRLWAVKTLMLLAFVPLILALGLNWGGSDIYY